MRKLLLSFCLAIICLAVNAQVVYVVKSGDTLESIAEENGVTVEALVNANPGIDQMMYNGLKLTIPSPESLLYSTASASGFGGSVNTSSSQKDHYRRSSLCLILLAHDDKQYAEAMARVFQNFPMPNRYNEHNVDVRVLRVRGKQSKNDIDRLLSDHNIGREIVSKWFNRDPYTGAMNMDLIHERGGYGAFHDDYLRSVNTARGTAQLRDEGIELLESTFVLVCDMDYVDRKKGFKIGSVIAGALSVVGQVAGEIMEAQAYDEARRGNYQKAYKQKQNADGMYAISALTGVGAEVLDDLGGFSVNIYSYLYRLRWNGMMTNTLFNSYWVDESTPRGEAGRRKDAFDNMRFGLEFVGNYKAKSGKTILLHCNDEDQVILDVCSRAVDKCVKDLARKHEVFRPRTPFYFEGQNVYSYIGSKEDVAPGKKYEIVQRQKNKKGETNYRRLGVVEAVSPWNNDGVDFSTYFDDTHKGTMFELKKGKYEELAEMPGLQIREMK